MHFSHRPSRSRRLVLQAVAGACLGAATLSSAWAQATWPTRPVTIVVPFPAGGGTDAFARPLVAQLSKQLGQQVIVDNRGGAGGTLGASVASKAAPDGYTFFMGAVHHTIAPSMYPRLDYDILTDFIPVALVASVPQVIVVNPQRVSAADLKTLMDYAKANPDRLNYASAGNGTSHHLAGELFKIDTKTQITHVPYRGAGPALQDLIAGQVHMMFDGLGSSAGHLRGGRIRALAVAANERAPGFPDIPTTAEAGLPGYVVATWYGLWAPKNTPAAIVQRMTEQVSQALNSDELKERWLSQGAGTPTLTGQAYGEFIKSEVDRWAKVVQASGAKLD